MKDFGLKKHHLPTALPVKHKDKYGRETREGRAKRAYLRAFTRSRLTEDAWLYIMRIAPSDHEGYVDGTLDIPEMEVVKAKKIAARLRRIYQDLRNVINGYKKYKVSKDTD